MRDKDLTDFSSDLRRLIVRISGYCEGPSHLGGALSLVEGFVVAQFCVLNRDFGAKLTDDHGGLILSKGHAVLLLYAYLIQSESLSEQIFAERYKNGQSKLLGHPVRCADLGIEFSTGSLGMGLGLGVGKALAHQKQGSDKNTVVFVGDGEMGEGSNYEAIMIASKFRLSNLWCFLDRNEIQQTGSVADISGQHDFLAIFFGMGWSAVEVVNGHCTSEIRTACESIGESNRPKLIILNTVKGKGLGDLEGTVASHNLALTDAQRCQFLKDIP